MRMPIVSGMGKGRMMPLTYLMISIVVMVLLHYIWPEKVVFDWPWRGIGLMLMAVGLALSVWGVWVFKKAGTTVKPFRESSGIVQEGPYRFTRNLMYLGLVIFLFGLWVLLGTLLPVIMVPIFWVLIRVRVISVEEKMLRKKFGQEYEDYCKKVRRWI